MRTVSRLRALAALAAGLWLLALPRLATAQWTAIGDMPRPERQGSTLIFHNARAVAAVTIVSPQIVRVRIRPGRAFGRDHSYAVVGRPSTAEAPPHISTATDSSTIRTSALTITIHRRPFRVAIADNTTGESLDEDDAELGIAMAGHATRVWKRLRLDEQVFGFGEKSGPLNKRGKMLGGYAYSMWNTDAYGYDWGTDPLYASFPFFIVLGQGRAHGIFLDNTYRTYFEFGKEFRDRLSFGAEDGDLNYYVIDGPTPKDVVRRYADLTGHMPLPPLWALGYHQCRYSYYPESKVRFIAENFRQRHIPADVIWLDIHYLDGYNPFTWDPVRFPDPAGLVRDLAAEGFRLVTIIDPHPKKQPGWSVYDSGLAGDEFVHNADGSIYEGPVWPSRAEKDPGPSVFPDFSKPSARTWWGTLFQSLVRIGIAGIWNDMNEPAVFVAPTWTMPLTVRHDNDGQLTDHREIHTVYGQLMSRATFEGLQTLRPDERPFVLTRATFAGGQRYAALWAGDNQSRWEDLRQSLPMLMNLGLAGMPLVGVDIGGFGEAPTPELFTRWLQTGIFYPFMRVHTSFGTPDQEPWSYGVTWEALNRRAVERRYELLPYIYTVMGETARTGLPALRPLLLEYPDDSRTWDQDEEFMFGSSLLVAPVLHEAVKTRDVYLPRGRWYEFETGTRYEGGRSIAIPVTIDSIPVFVREGAFIFRQPVVQNTEEMHGQPLSVWIYPAAQSSAQLYEDDGHSLGYQRGEWTRRQFSQARTTDSAGDDTQVIVGVDAPTGSFRAGRRGLELTVRWTGHATHVTVARGSQPAVELRRGAPDKLAGEGEGWTMSADGFVHVRLRDEPEPTTVTIGR